LALRVTSEMTWTLQRLPCSERLIQYETRLSQFPTGSKCLDMCQYDRRRFAPRFAPEVLLGVLRSHPITVVGTVIYDGFYYISPADLLGDDVVPLGTEPGRAQAGGGDSATQRGNGARL
jgi:hypothetical protein